MNNINHLFKSDSFPAKWREREIQTQTITQKEYLSLKKAIF